MPLGPLNRRGVLYRNTPTAGDGGAPVDSLAPLRNLPLTVETGDDAKDVQVGSRVSLDADIVWKTRWFEGLEPNMIMTFEGDTFRITRRQEIGRRVGWRIWAQEIR